MILRHRPEGQYRFVEYEQDAHVQYQCMTCKQFLPHAGNYCSHCGVRFSSQMECRPRECPAWAWKRWGAEWQGKYWEYRCSRPTVTQPKVEWILECRTDFVYDPESDGFDWEPDNTWYWEWGTREYWNGTLTAHQLFRHVCNERYLDDKGRPETEYRFVRVIDGERTALPAFAPKIRP
jgi:hypothetical protein